MFVAKYLLAKLYVIVGICLTREKYLHDPTISPRGVVIAMTTSLTPPHLLKCMYQEREDSGNTCVLSVALDFGTVLMVWLFFVFHFFRLHFIIHIYRKM